MRLEEISTVMSAKYEAEVSQRDDLIAKFNEHLERCTEEQSALSMEIEKRRGELTETRLELSELQCQMDELFAEKETSVVECEKLKADLLALQQQLRERSEELKREQDLRMEFESKNKENCEINEFLSSELQECQVAYKDVSCLKID